MDEDTTMTKDERSATAAEYVMGTLPVGERKAVRLALETDEALLDDVHSWERHFGALNASIAPEIPPPSLWDRIERSLPEAETAVGAVATVATAVPDAANDNVLRRSRNRWRLGTLAAALAAASRASWNSRWRSRSSSVSTTCCCSLANQGLGAPGSLGLRGAALPPE